MKLWTFRCILIAGFPGVMGWAVASEFGRGLRHAARLTWLELGVEMESFKQLWQNGPRPQPAEKPWTVDRDGRVDPRHRKIELRGRPE